MLSTRVCSRRKSNRKEIDLPVISIDTVEKCSKIKNINMSGIYLETDHLLHLGEKMIIKFRMPGISYAVSCYCKVVRHEFVKDLFDNVVNGYGIEFLNFNDPGTQNAIKCVLNQESPENND